MSAGGLPRSKSITRKNLSAMVDAYIAHRMVIESVAEMLRRGLQSPVFRSANLPGGDDFNRAIIKRYRNRVKDL